MGKHKTTVIGCVLVAVFAVIVAVLSVLVVDEIDDCGGIARCLGGMVHDFENAYSGGNQ